MSGHQRDFQAELEALEARLPHDRWGATEGLRALREQWARAEAGLDPKGDLVVAVRAAVERGLARAAARRAAEQLAAAESLQWQIGTLATGAGEGLASMFEVRVLQLARAWLLSVDDEAHDEARALAHEVRSDPNRVGDRLRAHVDALLARLRPPQ